MKSLLRNTRLSIGTAFLAVLFAASTTVGGCLSPDLKELNPCLVSGIIDDVDVKKVEKVDILFVIDNSGSMKEEQAKLLNELPRMVTILTSGDMNPDDGINPAADFPPVKDLHVGVVSTDMGLPGIKMSPDPENKCVNYGDDGKFLHQANVAGDPNLVCPGSGTGGGYPLFLSFVEGNNVETFANDFQCITALGTGGCGFEMQLEAPLKALWPANPENLSEEQAGQNIKFFDDTAPYGDERHRDFLRGTLYHSTQSDQLSLLAIIIVTDEEDCSAGAQGNLDFLEHPNSAPPNIKDQPLNLRCYYDTNNRFPTERYVNAFRALRPGYEQLVVFAAIVGIPNVPELDPANFDPDGDGMDEVERDNYYNTILGHPQMQETIRADGQNLEPACTIDNDAYDPNDPNSDPFITKAAPARRLVKVARGFGENGVVATICQDNFTGAMNSIIEAISKQLGGVCLPRKLVRNASGKVNCDIIWEMPPGQNCSAFPFLTPPPAEKPQETDEGRAICVVNQVAVVNPGVEDPSQALESGQQGWYYDDFSLSRLEDCKAAEGEDVQRVAFTLTSASGGETADPPAGVTVKLQCLNEVQSIVSSEEQSAGEVGSECNATDECGDYNCNKTTGTPCLACYADARICVLKCNGDSDCPAAWVCDDRPETTKKTGMPICINPTCGE
jgi:hypothetical protein